MSPALSVVGGVAPLIGADRLNGTAARVLVVEDGEGAQSARDELASPDIVIVAYAGAPQRWGWPSLKGRSVDIFPTSTQQAWQQALTIKGYLVSLQCDAHLIDTREEPETWDIGDFIAEGGTPESFRAYLERHRELPQPPAASAAPAPSSAVTRAIPDEPLPQFTDETQAWMHFGLERGPGGQPWSNLDTAMKVISQHPETRTALWYDEFSKAVMLGDRRFKDHDASNLTLVMQRNIHLRKMNTTTVAEACSTYAKSNPRHPVREWLQSLPPWDGEKRLEQLLPIAFGTPADEYTAAVGRCFLIGMVARAMQPGCQLDTMPVFEGSQSLGKTSALREIGGKQWYSSNNAGMQEKDFLQGLQGYWLIEIEEMESINRSSLERTKAILSRTKDDFRWSYARNVESYSRQCVFAGTTNSDTWNVDSTGARRFWPVACTVIDKDWIIDHRALLFAEALARYHAGEDWYKVPVERAREEQELRRLEDAWQAKIERNLEHRTEYTIEDAMDALELKSSERGRHAVMRIADVLKSLGWRVYVLKRDGKSTRIYKPINQLVERVERQRDEFDDDVPY